jgi:hypothetical protein
VATAVMQRESHGTRQDQNTSQNNDRDTLFMLSGIALMVFGAGLILSNSVAQGYLSRLGFSNLTENVLPDLERYLKLRSM